MPVVVLRVNGEKDGDNDNDNDDVDGGMRISKWTGGVNSPDREMGGRRTVPGGEASDRRKRE